MTIPVRIQRRRAKGFDLQSTSMSQNGLPCVYVGRPTQWGNPYKPGDVYKNIFDAESEPEPMTLEAILEAFEFWLKGKLAAKPDFLEPLRGRNLACFCSLKSRCHADILLTTANL